MEKKLITITEDELWMWKYWCEHEGDSPSSEDSSGDEVVLSGSIELSPLELEGFSTQTTESEITESPTHNYWIKQFQEEEKKRPSPTKTAQRIIANQRFLHIEKMREDDSYRTSYNTLLKRNQEE